MESIRVIRTGSRYTHSSDFHLTREHGSGDWLALLLLSPAEFNRQGSWQKVPQHTLMIYRQGTRQEYKAAGVRFCNDWFHFFPRRLADFEELGLPVEEPVLLSDSQPLSQLVQQMASEQLAGRERGEEILDHYARLFFLTAADLIHRPDPARSHPYYPILSEVRAEIRSSPASQWTVPQLAAMAGVSVDYFQHLYRACFGVSPAADVIAARLDYGCYLLRTTDLPVWRVAELCGYHSDVHFMRQFRRTMGMTPTQYRG